MASGASASLSRSWVSRADRRYPDRPIVGVGAVILVEAGSPIAGLPVSFPEPRGVVLVKRRFEPLAGRWSLPGGALEVGETLEAGVAREILEETGLIVDVGPVVEVFDRIMFDDSTIDAGPTFRPGAASEVRSGAPRVLHHYVLIDYLCRPTGGVLAAGSDVSDVSIADPNALVSYDVTPKVEAVVARALELAGE
jgi:8-oxo-dGTP diphosphatase